MEFKKGNILRADSEALVNTVNTVGVMGKGIALEFKNEFPLNFERYKVAVEKGDIKVGKVFLTETNQLTPKYIINFPTKQHWRNPSKIEYIKEGLIDLVKTIEDYNITSIAIPPLGCGNGRLNWNTVKLLIKESLEPLQHKVDIQVFEPGYNDQKTYVRKNVELTSARAMMIYAMDRYQILGYSINMLVAHKLAYFLQKLGEPLNLQFEKGTYGPYAHNLLHLLKYMHGTFIYFDYDENKPGTSIKINPKRLETVNEFYNHELSEKQRNRLDTLLDLIEGFESSFGLELLGTVSFVMEQEQVSSFNEIKNAIFNWTERKKSLIKDYHIEVALERLKSFQFVN